MRHAARSPGALEPRKRELTMTDVVMPKRGESIVEGTLTKWLKKPGERVERDEPLFEISTDKVDTEIPAPASGTLSDVLVEEGQTVAINTVVAHINEEGAAAAPAAPAQSAKVEEQPQTGAEPEPDMAAPAAASNGSAPKAAAPRAVEPPTPQPAAPEPSAPEQGEEPSGPLSPIVRKLAREFNIDLKQIRGTG